MNDVLAPENAEKYSCKCCDFKCSKKSNWDRHILTMKHKRNDKPMTHDEKITPKNAKCFQCECGKEYKHRQGLWSHKKRCKKALPIVDASNNIIIELLKQNHEFKELIVEQNKQMIAMVGKMVPKDGTLKNPAQKAANKAHNAGF